jgi:hypothetical protein
MTNEVLNLQYVSVNQNERAAAALREFPRKKAAYSTRANDEDRAVETVMSCPDTALIQFASVHQS